MSAVEIIPQNFTALDVAPLLAFYGVGMIGIVQVGSQARIVVNNNMANFARRILNAYRVRHTASQVQLIRFTPGVRGQLDQILRLRPFEMYPVEGNTYAIKTRGSRPPGGIGILSAQGSSFGALDPNMLSQQQQMALRQSM